MNFFHTLNRGVDKRIIFLDDQDRFRFIHDLFEFNDENRVGTSFYTFNKSNDIACRKIEKRTRKLLVNIHAFCLMSNHYHLLISPLIENGVSKFMKKLNMGYAKYFNEKYKRVGALFQGRYKSVAIINDRHFLFIPYYIHLNPLDFSNPEWRERKLHNLNKALDFLENYRWSSHLDYTGKKNFPSVTNRDFLTKFWNRTKGYNISLKNWLKDLELEEIKGLTLE